MDEDRVPLDGGPAGGPADGPADFTADGGGPLAGWMQPKPAEPQRPADMALKSSATAWPQQPAAAAAAALSMAAPGLDTPSMPPMARASNPQSASPAVLQPAAVGQQQQQQQQMALATEPADKQSSPAGRGGAGGQQRRTCFCGCQKPYAESSGVPADALAAAPDARADASPSAAALVQLTEPAGGSAFSSVGPAAALQVQQSQLQGQGRPAPPAAPDGQLSAVPSAWEALSPSPSRFPLGGHDTRRPSSPDSAARDPPQQSRRQRQQQPQAQLLQASLLQPDMASSNNSSSGNTSNNSYSNSNSNRNDNRTTNNTDNSASTTQSVPLQDPRRPVPPPLPTTLDHQPHSSRDAMGILHIVRGRCVCCPTWMLWLRWLLSFCRHR
ncbi:hypothetical protein BC831DRAFT_231671 [Entophlyctis helioformis]|nr:hypothetical protein BC831DRAFT_231671 [Entophlyctis helioformis]